MKAITQSRYGGVETLALDDVARPSIGDDEVLIEVRAAGVDRGVWHLMTGMPYAVRLAGYGMRAPRTSTPGLDLAGVVTEVGSNVTAFAAGEEVFGIGTGAYAQYAVAPEGKLAHKPSDLAFEEAAAVAISGLTALQAVRDQAAVQPGERVLVLGASGGVGTYAVQIAKSFGAQVTGVSSTSKVDLVRSLGADHVVDYLQEDIADAGVAYDVILDIGGNRSLSDLRKVMTPKGRLVIIGGETEGKWMGGADRQLRAMLLSPFVGQKLTAFVSKENGADMAVLGEMIADGRITPKVDRTFSLEEVPKAIAHLEDGHARGKIVITI